MINPYAFGPATEQETIVYGASRPGYNSRRVVKENVDEWMDFMLRQDIRRVICLLPPSQLAYYDDLLSSYEKTFGAERVCWAPIEDYELADLSTLIDLILPFLADSEKRNERVVVHCSGGNGRTGHVLAAWLVSFRGLSNLEAIEVVRQSGRNAQESGDEGLDALLNACRKKFAG